MVTHGLHLNLMNSIDGSSTKLFQCLLRVKYGIHPRLHMKVNKLPISWKYIADYRILFHKVAPR